MAYIPGRYIAECTRNTYDIFTHAKENNLPGMLLLIDFEKAFDSVNFEFIVTTLEIFGLDNYYFGDEKGIKLSACYFCEWKYFGTF